MSGSNLQTRLISLQREIEALKVSSRLPSRLRSYSATLSFANQPQIDPSNTWAGGWKIKITYASGENDIISEFLCPADIWAQTPSGNTQQLHAFATWTDFSLTVVSTRPIEKIEFVS